MDGPRTIPEWLALVGESVVAIGHKTGWSEQGMRQDGQPDSMAMCFFTLDDEKARRALALLGAAGLLCEQDVTPCDVDFLLPHSELWLTIPVSCVVDGLRALNGTKLPKGPER